METDGILKLVIFIFIVFGILQIILFFKVWKMTNDVSKIKSRISPSSAKLEYMKGDLKKAQEILDIEIFEVLIEYSEFSKETYDREFDSLVATYEPTYKKMGLSMANVERFRDKESITIRSNTDSKFNL